MNRLFPLWAALVAALPACNTPWANQPPPRPLFGPGAVGGPSTAFRSAVGPGQAPGAVQQPGYAAQPPYQNGGAPASRATAPAGPVHGGQALGPEAELHEIRAGGVRLRVVVFSTAHYNFRVVDQPSPSAGGGVIAQIMPHHSAIAGINGGFFHPDFQPLGLLVTGGGSHGHFADNRLVTGSLLVINREPYLVWNSEFLGLRGVTDMVQGGPRLVSDGQPVPRLDTAKSAARTFVATDGKRMWAIGTADGATLAQLAYVLATPGTLPGLRVERALNLDGGRSSAIWVRTASGRVISDPGFSTVRNYVAIVPRG